MIKRIIIVVFTVLFWNLIVLSGKVWAWGAGMHIAQGEFILQNLSLVLPAVRELLQTFPLDFLYGIMSADIFIGKGSRRRYDHCHNWSTGWKMLSVAQAPFEKAFTFGYLAHLAADTIAHNFYVPNQLYRTSTTRKFGHLYWEYRSDIFTEKKYWKIAKEVIANHNPEHDTFISRTVPNRVFSFKTKKLIFSTTIHLYDSEHWRKGVHLVSKNSRWEVRPEYIEFLRKLSFYLTLDFFKHPEEALCLHYDPVGSESIREAKRRRRLVRRLNGKSPTAGGYEISPDLLGLFYDFDSLTT